MSEFLLGIIAAIIPALAIWKFTRPAPKIVFIESSQDSVGPRNDKHEFKVVITVKNVGSAPAHICKIKSPNESRDIDITVPEDGKENKEVTAVFTGTNRNDLLEVKLFVRGRLMPYKHTIQRNKHLTYENNSST